MTHNCPSCGSSDSEIFYRIEGAPAHSSLPVSSRAEAVAVVRGDVILTCCSACGFVFNAAFDPALMIGHDHPVEDTEPFAVRGASQERLVDHLSKRYALIGKDILDIGARNSELVTLLCERGRNHRVEFALCHAPELVAGAETTRSCRWSAVAEAAVVGPADLVCCTMLLEHSADPSRVLQWIRGIVALRPEARLFLQVSNFTRTLKHCAFWEIDYQTCSYFRPGALHRLLVLQGFAVGELWTDFDGQYLMADAHVAAAGDGAAAPANVETIADLSDLIARFAHECREKQAMWCEILHKLAAAGNRIAIWGADAGTASFLTTLAVGDEVSYVVDVNPDRQDKYTPGTGHRIVSPDAMAAMRPDVVIVTNSALTFEIRDLLAKAGCAPTLLIA